MKNRFRLMLCALVCAVLFGACGKPQPPSAAQMPDDFAFVFVCDFTQVDTQTNTVKNTYYFNQGDAYAVEDFAFTASQMQEIYDAFVKYRVSEMPEAIDPEKEYMCIPPSCYALTYTVDGQTRRIVCNTGAGVDQPGISGLNNRFLKFMTVIRDIVYASDAYHALPEGPYIE